MDDRGALTTEHRNPKSERLDRMSVVEAFNLVNSEDATITSAIAAARDEICQAVELVVAAFRAGGRLIYVGAGTSGRLGVLDATECPPTFLANASMVEGVLAGGFEALTRSVEGAEDNPEDGAAAMDERAVGPADVVFAITTGGTTPFVHGAIRRAGQRGAKTVFLACVPTEQVADDADVSIRVVTGPEVLTGSTRMKAGSATKMVLNMVTTIAMVQIGKVYRNLMVDVNTAGNAKLVDRGARIVQTVTGRSPEASRTLLEAAGGHVKTALVMHARRVDLSTAGQLLREVDGQVGRLIETHDRDD
ncbi:MAG: N-acetylmuramic acid 6-phosphate etherase [Planctomycetes bacterium]|nr:N-acetylmuramic acid 6-phosphate etherase [Planctomycetota bacterium]